MTEVSEVFGDLLYSYTRADAINDGVLIPVDPQICKEAGIKWPVAITDHLWSYIDPENINEMIGQSVSGRLWDLLWMFRTEAASPKWRGEDRIRLKVIFLMKTAKTPARQETITVIAACGPGDFGEPVITLMLPEDD